MKSRILLGVVFSIAAFSMARADSVFVKGRDKAVVGTIKLEDGKGVVVNTLVDKKKIDEFFPAADVIEVQYDDLKPGEFYLKGGAYRTALQAERDYNDAAADAAKRKTILVAALKQYNDVLKAMMPHKYGKRMVEYKLATLTLRQALVEQQPTDKALARLQGFKVAYPNSWQIVHVMPLIAQTQLDSSDFKGAAVTFQEMADMDTLPADVRIAAELEVVRVIVRSGDVDKAQKKLDALTAKAAGIPTFAARVKMVKAEVLVSQKNMKEAEPLLKQVIKDSSDRQVKAIAHNALGECLYNANRHGEALWEFLWVDAVFNQDRSEHAKALYYLWKTFEQLNNAERSQECRVMLLSDKQFAGTEYQLKAAKEAAK